VLVKLGVTNIIIGGDRVVLFEPTKTIFLDTLCSELLLCLRLSLQVAKAMAEAQRIFVSTQAQLISANAAVARAQEAQREVRGGCSCALACVVCACALEMNKFCLLIWNATCMWLPLYYFAIRAGSPPRCRGV
jgi:hypothetical protein